MHHTGPVPGTPARIPGTGLADQADGGGARHLPSAVPVPGQDGAAQSGRNLTVVTAPPT
jgi:hypothetical protein